MNDDASTAEKGEQPYRVSRSKDERKVNVQRQVTRQGNVEYSATYQRITHYDDGYEAEGIRLSLFIKDEATTRMLYECLRELVEEDEL